MKKKTRSKLRNDIAVSFLLAIFVSLAGASLNSVLFYNSFYRTLSKLNEEPIATITFKYKTAQRKFLERVIWDRLRQESPLYNGDTIHTSELSEATVTFTDGNKLVLQENSMIQIFMESEEEGGYNASVMRGAAFVDSVDAKKGFGLTSNGVKIDIDAGSSVFAGSKVQVINGKAYVTDGNGTMSAVSEGEALSVDSGAVSKPVFTVRYPSPNEKVLFHDGVSRIVPFAWSAQNFDLNQNLRLELAADKHFKNILGTKKVAVTDNLEIELSNGTYYWRFVNPAKENVRGEDPVEAEGKIQMILSQAPNLVAPVKNYSYSYRTRFPAVRLIWSEAQQASAYRVVVADNPSLRNPLIDQRNTTTSAIYSTLGEGEYYWQITPYYTINRIGYEAPSEISSFRISRQGQLLSPDLYLPSENSTVDREKSAKPVSFSWHADPEASRYRITISERNDLRNPVVTSEVTSNSFQLKARDALRDKKYYWTVQTIDSEENISEVSKIQAFFALEGKVDQRTIEPADGYRVAWSLMQDMVFTWKRNLPENYVSTIEIASDSNFRNIVYTGDGNGFSLKGLVLPIGNYWWRLKSVAGELEQEFCTDAKNFEVMDLLDASVLQAPLGRAVARETKPYECKWKEVDGADFYKVSIFNSSEELIFEDNVMEPHVFIDMYNGENFIDKAMYRIEVQARANAIPGVMSRRSGKLVEARFQLFKLRPVEVRIPKRNAVLDGLEAFVNGVDIEWTAVDGLSDAQVVITRVDLPKPLVMQKIPSDKEFASGKRVAPKKVTADPEIDFEAGTYEIIVYAHTLEDGIDISNTDESKRGVFKLTPYKKMEAAKNLLATPSTVDGTYLKNNTPELKLSWAPVSGATSYAVKIKGVSLLKNRNVSLVKEVSDTSITISLTDEEFKEIAEANGKYQWTVEAKKIIANSRKRKSLGGEIASSNFTIDVPDVSSKGIKSSGSKTKFGRKK